MKRIFLHLATLFCTLVAGFRRFERRSVAARPVPPPPTEEFAVSGLHEAGALHGCYLSSRYLPCLLGLVIMSRVA